MERQDFFPALGAVGGKAVDGFGNPAAGDGNPQALGYVLGTSLDELDSVDVTAYDVPVYFPTIGMGDDEVSELAAIIRSGL